MGGQEGGTYEDPWHVRTVQAEVRSFRVGASKRWAEVVGIVATGCALHLVVVRGLEGLVLDAGVDGGLVNAAERLVGGDTGGNVEGIESDVAGVVQREKTRVDDLLSVGGRNAQTLLQTLQLAGHGSLGVGGEGGTVIVGSTPDGVDVSSTAVVVVDIEVLGVDVDAVLNNVAGDRGKVNDRLSRNSLQASNLVLDRGLVTAGLLEKLLGAVVALLDSEVRAVGGTVVTAEAKIDATSQVAHGNGASELADGLGRAEESADGASTGGFTVDGNLVRVTTESGNVRNNPVETGDLIRDTVIAGHVGSWYSQEAESGQTVVDLDDNDVLTGSKLTTVTASAGARASGETTAVNPEVDWTEVLLGASLGDVGSLDVDEQAVLAAAALVWLSAVWAVRSGLDGLAGLGVQVRVLEASWWVSVRDTLEAEGLLVPETNEGVAVGGYADLVLGGGNRIARHVLLAGLRAENGALAVVTWSRREGDLAVVLRVLNDTLVDPELLRVGRVAGIGEVVELVRKIRCVAVDGCLGEKRLSDGGASCGTIALGHGVQKNGSDVVDIVLSDWSA